MKKRMTYTKRYHSKILCKQTKASSDASHFWKKKKESKSSEKSQKRDESL